MIKEFINRLRGPRKVLTDNNTNAASKIGIARWCIQQFCICPHCNHEFDIIQVNLKRKANQGTMKISQKQVTRYDKDKFDYNEVTVDIPTPPYYGAFCDDTENLDEHINCDWCGGPIVITQAVWGFGKNYGTMERN